MSQHPAVRHQMIATATEMLLISDSCLPAVQAELRYYSDDPFAVQMVMSIDQSPSVSWTFGRELLINGTTMPSGIGDVQVFPTHDGMVIELRSGSTVASLLAHTPDIEDFTDRTLSAVPMGTEMDHYGLDNELAALPVHDTFDA